MGAWYGHGDAPQKQDVSGASLGYTPSMQGIRARVQGETEEEDRRYVQRMQGVQARNLANARGLDTSGMAWDGEKFTDANFSPWYADPRFLGPVAVGAAGGIGALAGGGAGAGAGAAGSIAAPTSAESAAGIASMAGSGLPAGSAALGGVAPAAAAGGSGFMNTLRNQLMSPQGIATAGTIAASLAAGGDGTNDATRASEEQARRMQAITEARMRRVDPLHEAITQLAFGRLPVSSRQGLTLPRVTLPE